MKIQKTVDLEAFQITKATRNNFDGWPKWLKNIWNNRRRGELNSIYSTVEMESGGPLSMTINSGEVLKMKFGDWVIFNPYDGSISLCKENDISDYIPDIDEDMEPDEEDLSVEELLQQVSKLPEDEASYILHLIGSKVSENFSNSNIEHSEDVHMVMEEADKMELALHHHYM
jgi:hypothetical protein